MTRRSFAAVALTVLLAPCALAETKAPARPVGTWTRDAGDRKISFTIKPDTLVCKIEDNGGNTLEVQAAYGIAADGTLFGIITGAESKGAGNAPEKGEFFSFRYEPGKDTLTISDLASGKGASDEAKALIQGEYKKGK